MQNEQFGDLIVATYKLLKINTERVLRPFGIGMGQLNILILFYARPGISLSQTDFVKLLDIDKGNVSRNVKKLLEKGYLEAGDAPSKHYRLSSEGHALRPQIMQKLMGLQGIMTEGIEDSELEMTFSVLNRVLKNLSDENNQN